MRPVDVIAKYAGVEIGVLLRAREKHAGETEAVYWMEYPSIEHALEAVAEDLFQGRVEEIRADGEPLPDEEVCSLVTSSVRGMQADQRANREVPSASLP